VLVAAEGVAQFQHQRVIEQGRRDAALALYADPSDAHLIEQAPTRSLRSDLEQMLRHRACGGGLNERGQAHASSFELKLHIGSRRRKVRIIERVPVSDSRAVRLRVGVQAS
jgi:hypothetical protein